VPPDLNIRMNMSHRTGTAHNWLMRKSELAYKIHVNSSHLHAEQYIV
jgi:hypothetical protein